MPWKGEKEAYKIWLSEIILQQTRVEQGSSYYEKFVAAFPTVKELALADEKTVFKLWEGLGYYSRCRNLIATAKYIYHECGGKFPDLYEEILKLKGIGPYTAAAIASFAFNLPHAVVDGNVFRVLARIYGIDDAIDEQAGKNKFQKLALALLDKKQPGVYNQAIMDFGATICKPLQPLCLSCVFKKSCIAYLNDKVSAFPVKKKKLKKRNRYFYFFPIKYKNHIAIRERLRKDIWQHLHEFPMVELEKNAGFKEALSEAKKMRWITEATRAIEPSPEFRQQLTHQTIHAIFIKCEVDKKLHIKDYQWIHVNEIADTSFPKIINEFLKTYTI